MLQATPLDRATFPAASLNPVQSRATEDMEPQELLNLLLMPLAAPQLLKMFLLVHTDLAPTDLDCLDQVSEYLDPSLDQV